MRPYTGSPDVLFTEGDFYSLMEQQRAAITRDVNALDVDRVLGTPIPDLIAYFSQKSTIDVPVLHRDREYIEQMETTVQLTDRFRYNLPNGPVEVAGTAYILTIPYTGDTVLFRVRPNTWDTMPPRARVTDAAIIISVSGRDLPSEQVKRELDGTIVSIEKYLNYQRASADPFNASLPSLVEGLLTDRKNRLLKDRQTVASLGFPLRERPDAAKTYAAPEVRRKVQPVLPAAPKGTYHPEPVLDEANYKHILSVIENMTHVMERSPTAFREMGEEDLRQHFLVQLNGHFEGSATGETFNAAGKTDILIRAEDRNIFIGECKFWRGEKAFIDTIDQVLSYLSWRDTKAAILLFNRNKGFSDTIAKARAAADTHPHRKRGPTHEGETRTRYVFANPNDRNREIILTLLVFDVPSA